MANIFKTTLKKDVITDIVSNSKREIKFPITKFWATRFADEFNLDEKTFTFKIYDSLELSSPSNKDTGATTYVFEHVRTYVDGDEFIIEFKDIVESCSNDDTIKGIENVKIETIVTKDMSKLDNVEDESGEYIDNENVDNISDDEIEYISNDDVYISVKQWFDEEGILDELYEYESIIPTNARQVIILPNGKVLGSKKTLPVNNDVEVRIKFDMSQKIYFDTTPDFDIFENEIYKLLSEIMENNFVFIWKRHTGIFMEDDGRIYFGIKYSTRKVLGFDRKYNVQ